MRSLALFSAILLISACATAPPAARPPGPATDASTPAQDNARALRLAAFLTRGAGEGPTLQAVQRALGPADITRQDGAGAALTYRLESCALFLVFSADARNSMRLAEAHPGPRRTGAAAPSMEQCAAEALTRGAPGV